MKTKANYTILIIANIITLFFLFTKVHERDSIINSMSSEIETKNSYIKIATKTIDDCNKESNKWFNKYLESEREKYPELKADKK